MEQLDKADLEKEKMEAELRSLVSGCRISMKFVSV